jgi:hypothetical protein
MAGRDLAIGPASREWMLIAAQAVLDHRVSTGCEAISSRGDADVNRWPERVAR